MIDIYTESEHEFHKTFGDALKFFADKFGREPKTALEVAATMVDSSGLSLASPSDKSACRQKLQDLIFEMAIQFERDFRDTGTEPAHCARIRSPLRLPEATLRDAVLRGLSADFHNTEECRRRCKVENLFQAGRHPRKMQSISLIVADSAARKPLEKIQETIQQALRDPEGISCRSCGTMGDAVVACALDSSWKLHSMDRVHGPISTALSLEHEIHDSVPKLRAAANATPL